MKRTFWISTAAALGICLTTVGQEAPPNIERVGERAGGSSKSSTATIQPGETPANNLETAKTERETAAWGFVMQHHPQLGEVLSRLKTIHPMQYEKAINQVATVAERIAKYAKTDPKRGEFELQDWRYESQIKLLAAKTSLSAKIDDDAKSRIEEIVRKQIENRMKIAEYERDRALNRAKMYDDQVLKLRENLDRDVAARIADLQREVLRTRRILQSDGAKPNAKTKTATGAE